MSIIFHIGYPKAGSTTLQKSLWARCSDIVNLGSFPLDNVGIDCVTNKLNPKQPINCDERIKQFYNSINMADSYDYKKRVTTNLFDQLLESYNTQGKSIIFSSEFIVSTRFSFPDIIEKTRRISDLGSNIKIIIVIRKQQDLLASLYRDHPYDPALLEVRLRHVSADQFIEIDSLRPYFSHTKSLKYDELYKHLVKLFGRQNILMIPLEMMQNELGEFSNLLGQFCEVPQTTIFSLLKNQEYNTGVTGLYNQIRALEVITSHARQLLLPNTVKELIKPHYKKLLKAAKSIGKKHKVVFNDKTLENLRLTYSNSNQELSSELGINLKKYGYFTSY